MKALLIASAIGITTLALAGCEPTPKTHKAAATPVAVMT